MAAESAPCARCGRPATEGHHPTGRSRRAYLDPELIVGLCRRCHAGEHAVVEALGLAGGRWDDLRLAELNGIERVELCLRRLAVTCGRLSRTGPGPAAPDLWALLARAFNRWAAELGAEVARLNHEHPDWRTSPVGSMKGRK